VYCNLIPCIGSLVYLDSEKSVAQFHKQLTVRRNEVSYVTSAMCTLAWLLAMCLRQIIMYN